MIFDIQKKTSSLFNSKNKKNYNFQNEAEGQKAEVQVKATAAALVWISFLKNFLLIEYKRTNINIKVNYPK